MRNSLFYILILLCSLSLQAQNKVDSLMRDSINKAAQSPDFLHAYIEIASPGKTFYSCYGHAAIRMQCPSKKLDYCFTFEMDMEKSSALDVFTHDAKAGFAAAPTPTFMQQYRKDGRGMMQYELNLSPHEKQTLWRLLDEQMAQGSNWTFDYYKQSCSSMVLWIINEALDSCQLDFPKMPECMQGTYIDALHHMTEQSPWYGIVWRIIIINGDKHGEPAEMMAPRIMAESLPHARIIKEGGASRPLLKGKPQQLFHTTFKDEPCWFTPWMALALLIVVIALAIMLIRKKKHCK